VISDDEDEQDDVIDPLVDSMLVLSEDPEMTSATLFAFCNDIAQKVHTYETIARRYGFADPDHMGEYLASHLSITAKIKELRSVYFSDVSTELRLRKLAGHAVLSALPSTADMMFNTKAPESVRIDALKAHARIAGVDGIPAGARDAAAASAAQASRFSIEILFASNGRMETITTLQPNNPAIEHETVEE
jgi:hypothetical protein